MKKDFRSDDNNNTNNYDGVKKRVLPSHERRLVEIITKEGDNNNIDEGKF